MQFLKIPLNDGRRKLIREGILKISGRTGELRDRRICLLSDSIISVKVRSENNWECKAMIFLDDCELVDIPDIQTSKPNTFQLNIKSRKKTYNFICSTLIEKVEWMKDIFLQIEEFRKLKSKVSIPQILEKILERVEEIENLKNSLPEARDQLNSFSLQFQEQLIQIEEDMILKLEALKETLIPQQKKNIQRTRRMTWW